MVIVMMSTVTKKYNFLYILFAILSFVCVCGPVLFFSIQGFIVADTVSRIILSFTSIGSIILAGTALLFKFKLRSPIFLALIGLWAALESLLPAVIAIAICIVLDEFVFSPLKKYYGNKTNINKEIDKRSTDN